MIHKIWNLDVVVFLMLLVGFAWFHHAEPGWNVNSRFALTLALAETGTPQVDRYVTRPGLQTEDLARYNGHLYSDKSIGTSLLGVPAVWAVQGLEAIADRTFPTPTRLYLVTLFSVGLTGALAGVLLMHWLALIWWPQSDADYSLRWSAFVSTGVMLGSMLFLYGTLFMSYLPATACLMAMLVLVERGIGIRKNYSDGSGEEYERTRPWVLFIAGLFGGLAVLCEYSYAAAAGLTGIYLASRLLTRGRYEAISGTAPRRFGGYILFALGGIIGIAPFLYYTISIFGRPTIPYEYHIVPQFREAMATGFMGASWPPNFDVLWLITFHPFRGIFVYSPALLLGTLGILWMVLAGEGRRAISVLCAACIAFYVVFNSCYYMWWGGWSFSPRHLAPAIPFMAAGLFPWIRGSWTRWFAALTLLAGVVVHLLVNATEPQPPDGGWRESLLHPDLTKFEYPAVFIRQTWARVTDGAFEQNAGSLNGLQHNLWSLLPLVIVWMLYIMAIIKLSRRPQ